MTMQFTALLNLQFAQQHGLNLQQALLFAFIYELPSWADHTHHDGNVFYRACKTKIIAELPILTDKPDTVYRLAKQLANKGLVEIILINNQNWFRVTDTGKTWNRTGSEKNPRVGPDPSLDAENPEKVHPRVGKKSEPGSEKNPTYHITNDQPTKGKEKRSPQTPHDSKPDIPEWLNPQAWQDWLDHRKETKNPVTDLAARKAINELSRLKAQGHDPVTVIEHSILNGWRGLFPPKPEIHPTRKQRDPFAPPPDYDYSVKGTWFDPENHR